MNVEGNGRDVDMDACAATSVQISGERHHVSRAIAAAVKRGGTMAHSVVAHPLDHDSKVIVYSPRGVDEVRVGIQLLVDDLSSFRNQILESAAARSNATAP
jgi:hypothetical protein